MSQVENNQNENQAAPGNADAEPQQAPAAEPSPTELLAAQLKAEKDKYLYLYAEFETYKKRAIKERSDTLKFGHEPLVRELLQVTDNLDRALDHTTNLDALVSGIKMVNQQLKDTLSKFGVTPVKSLGEKFDPTLHEAVGSEKLNTPADGEEGSVVREHQKGYTLHGRLLRPARVVVATK